MKKSYKLSKKTSNNLISDSEQTKFFEIYLKNKEDIEELEKILERLKKSYNLDDKEVLKLIKEKEKFVCIPVSVFKSSLAPLEAVVLFLKDYLEYGFHKIASYLNRDDRTIWLTYSNAIKKNIKVEISSEFHLPLLIFSDRKFSILESAVAYLKEMNKLSLKQISKLTGKNPKTIWTVYHRYKNKLKNG